MAGPLPARGGPASTSARAVAVPVAVVLPPRRHRRPGAAAAARPPLASPARSSLPIHAPARLGDDRRRVSGLAHCIESALVRRFTSANFATPTAFAGQRTACVRAAAAAGDGTPAASDVSGLGTSVVETAAIVSEDSVAALGADDEADAVAAADAQPPAPPPPPPPAPPSHPGALLPVPWGFDTVVGVMVLWLVAFWALGYVIVPGLLELLGVARETLSPRGQAIVHLLLDCGELAVTAGVLARCLRRYRPRELGWFRARAPPALRAARLAEAEAAARADGGVPRSARLRAALSGWVLPLALTVAAFPLVDAAAARAHALFPIVDAAADALGGGGGSGSGGGGGGTGAGLLEAAIAAGDPATSGLYFAVVALCAPLWEEAIFRGFLLPSLARSLRPPAAVAASALVFALAHFSGPRFVPLLLLGGLFGALFVRTRSLGTAVAAHALWNVYIFAHLLMTAGAGG